jgi:hypothetical protein
VNKGQGARLRAQGSRLKANNEKVRKRGGWEALIDRSLEDEKIRRYDGDRGKRHIKAKCIAAQGAE